MSKNNATKIFILQHALKAFNSKGIEYVGVREIANDLGLRVGNITYYFPTKDDIVVALGRELRDLNSKTIKAIEGLTMLGLLEMYRQVFENHYKYRCLFISFVHQFERNTQIRTDYLKSQRIRFSISKKNITELIENGYLQNTLTEKQIDLIVSSLALTSRFWLSESRISFRNFSKEKIFAHYLELIVHLLRPYATTDGNRDIEVFLKSL